MSFRIVLPSLLLLAAAGVAQKPTFEWQKRSATIDYGSVPVGKHSLAELPVGQGWRLGANQTTVLRLLMPAIVGDAVLAPGAYAVQLQRTAEATCALVATGSDVRIEGPLGKAAKPGKKLVIDWLKDGAAKTGNQPAKVVVQFGENEWSGAVTFPGNKTAAVGAWKLAVFSLPTALLEARDKKPVPVASLSKSDDEGFNLVLGKDEVRLVPWSQASTGGGGGGGAGAAPPAGSEGTTGTVEPLEIKVPTAHEVVEHLSAKAAKGEIVVEIAFGKEGLRLTVPEPKAQKGGK